MLISEEPSTDWHEKTMKKYLDTNEDDKTMTENGGSLNTS